MGAWICLLLSISVPAKMSPPPQAVTGPQWRGLRGTARGTPPPTLAKQTKGPFKQLNQPCPLQLSAPCPRSHSEPGATPLLSLGQPAVHTGSPGSWGPPAALLGADALRLLPLGGQPHPLLAPVGSFLEGSGTDGLNPSCNLRRDGKAGGEPAEKRSEIKVKQQLSRP